MMLDKAKITITREDGSPICGLAPEKDTISLTDDDQFLVIKKNGGTVETRLVYVSGLLELTLAALDELDTTAQKAICDGYGVQVN